MSKRYIHKLEVDNATLNLAPASTIGPTKIGDRYITTDGVVRVVTSVNAEGLATGVGTATVA